MHPSTYQIILDLLLPNIPFVCHKLAVNQLLFNQCPEKSKRLLHIRANDRWHYLAINDYTRERIYTEHGNHIVNPSELFTTRDWHLIFFAVPIRILIAECPQHSQQFIRRLGRGSNTNLIHPVFTDKKNIIS
ncbi:hypothetical protein D3C73_1012910 [compost metagenome]